MRTMNNGIMRLQFSNGTYYSLFYKIIGKLSGVYWASERSMKDKKALVMHLYLQVNISDHDRANVNHVIAIFNAKHICDGCKTEELIYKSNKLSGYCGLCAVVHSDSYKNGFKEAINKKGA